MRTGLRLRRRRLNGSESTLMLETPNKSIVGLFGNRLFGNRLFGKSLAFAHRILGMRGQAAPSGHLLRFASLRPNRTYMRSIRERHVLVPQQR